MHANYIICFLAATGEVLDLLNLPTDFRIVDLERLRLKRGAAMVRLMA